MPHDIGEDQLVHYFAGECSERKAARFEAWINADPDRKRRVERLRRIWEFAEPQSQDSPDVDAMWDNLARRLGSSEFEQKEARDQEVTDRPSRRRRKARRPRRHSSSLSYFLRVSAVVLSITAVTLAIWTLSQSSLVGQLSSRMRTITTEAGQRTDIQLGDGTRVTLNAKSELKIHRGFGGEDREVSLEGQAYFEVKPDKESPFLVHAGGTVTRVLGTKFEVGAYPEDESIRIVVAEGEVVLRPEDDRSENSIPISAEEMARMSKWDESVVHREIDPTPYLAWTEGNLVFQNAPFDKVARRLENKYNLRVRLNGSFDAVDHLNASFTDEPVEEVLSIVAETLDLRYERNGKTVTFFRDD